MRGKPFLELRSLILLLAKVPLWDVSWLLSWSDGRQSRVAKQISRLWSIAIAGLICFIRHHSLAVEHLRCIAPRLLLHRERYVALPLCIGLVLEFFN